MSNYIRRGVETFVREALTAFPVVHITGARQVGKSTLTQHLGLAQAVSVTLDDPAALSWAESDPIGFVQQAGSTPLIIDEIQRLPELSLALKAEVDRDRRPGRFVITGSSDFARGIGRKDSLAGRIIDVHLQPLAQQELEGNLADGTFIDRTEELLSLASQTAAPEALSRTDLARRIVIGGYPTAHQLSDKMRKPWFSSYTNHVTVVEETLSAESAQPERLKAILRLIAARQAGELVPAKLAQESGIPDGTVRNYLDTLQRLYLTSQAKAWKSNLTSREVSKAKAWVTDVGLAAWLSGQSETLLANPLEKSNYGHLVEAFVLQELAAQRSWADTEYELFHWRDSTGKEVDAIIERPDGSIIAIEVKSGATIKAEHAKHLHFLKEKLGKRFHAGFIIAPIAKVQPLGQQIVALPMSYLWRK